jgi:membrane associated rhomboid family serine protease
MSRWRVAGALWIVAGLLSAFIAFFITDPVTLLVFVKGAVAGIVLGAACLVRPSPTTALASTLIALVWLVAFSIVTALNITNPIEEVASVIGVAAFGTLAGALTFRDVPRRRAA